MLIKPMRIQTIETDWLHEQNIILHVLRLDEIHAVVSGNKWFKLHYYLQEAKEKGFTTIATFGGAYSNHIVATAFACNEIGMQSIGIIRGEKPQTLSHTLFAAQTYGMQLRFVSRENYKDKEAIKALFANAYWINEGGYGSLGATGAANIAKHVAGYENYTHIVCATGTGTTLAGLIQSALPHQTIIGVSALKNNMSIQDEVNNLLSVADRKKRYVIFPDYHFGGYAKYTPLLLKFMNELWAKHSVPLDFVYTAKALYGLVDLIRNKKITPSGSRILFIHTGGLQGNLSLPEKVLAFSLPV